MKRSDHEHGPPDAADALLGQLVEAAGREGRADPPKLAFADALRRAQALDPDLHDERARPARAEHALEDMLVAAREAAELDIATRARAPSPPSFLERRATSSSWRWPAALLTLAACLALVFSTPLGRTVATRVSKHAGWQATSDRLGSDRVRGSELRERDEPERAQREQTRRTPLEPTPEPPEALAPVQPPPAIATPRVDTITALERQAERALQTGRLDLADRLYRSIIAKAGRSPAAEAAFADRFTLAHRRGDEERLVELWSHYLRRFPRGRYADDARAGLCRLADADKNACWQRYVRDFPRGTYRGQARRALERTR